MAVRRTRRRLAVATLVALAAVLVLAVGASAQENDDGEGGSDTLSVRAVDGRDPDAVEVEFFYTGPRAAVTDLVLRESGRVVEHTPPVLLEESQDFGIVLAIDTSGSMEANAAFERATDAAAEFVRNKEPGDQVAIVGFSTRAEVVQRFTDDTDTLLDAIDRLGVGGGTALYDAVRESVNLFADTDLVPNIVLLTDGEDSDSATTLEGAQGLLDDAGALLFSIGVESEDLDLAPLESLASATGGVVRTSAEPAELGEIYREVQSSLRRQFRTTFVSETDRTGPIELTATIGTAQDRASYQVGARLDSRLDVQPVPSPEPEGIAALQNDAALYAALALAVIAAAGAAYAVGATVLRGRSTLDSVLEPYDEGHVVSEEYEGGGMATTAIVRRAVDFTGRFAERRGILVRVEDQLEQANLPLRAGEALFFYLVGVVLVALLAAVVVANVIGTLLIIILVVLTPPAVVSFLASRRRRQFEAQLPDMLNLLASTLRAGYSLMQGVEAAAQEVREPMKRELQRVNTESRLGMPVETALDGVVERMSSKDMEWAVMAIAIQREVGGNLAELLQTVAETMTERERLRRDVQSLTAEGRVSAFVLGLLPIGLGAAMFAINPGYIGRLFEDNIGSGMVVGAGLLMGVGFFWMYKLIDIEV